MHKTQKEDALTPLYKELDDVFRQLFQEVRWAAVVEEPDVDLCISMAEKKEELVSLMYFGHNYAKEAAAKCLAVLAREVKRCRSE
jgi:hypothetical protein